MIFIFKRALNLVTGQIVAIKRIKLEDQNKEDIDSLMVSITLIYYKSIQNILIILY